MIEDYTNIWSASKRNISAKVELFHGSTLVDTMLPNGAIKSFTIERVGSTGKFFGFAITHQIKLELIDKERVIEGIGSENRLKAYLKERGDYLDPYPQFFVENVSRDEVTSDMTIIAKDAILSIAPKYTFNDLNLIAPYTIRDVATACANTMGVSLRLSAAVEDSFYTAYPIGANLDGSESLREILDAVAEATQTIYFINSKNELIFKRLNSNVGPVSVLTPNVYMSLKTDPPKTISNVVSATELGDNVGAGDSTGETQYVRDNPFWSLNEEIATLVEDAVTAIKGLTLTPFDCLWRGNPSIEIGDLIEFEPLMGGVQAAIVLNEIIKYNGGLTSQLYWSYEEGKETHSNPSTLGAALHQTSAKVDKVNKQISLVVNDVSQNKENIASLSMETGQIFATVATIEEQANTSIAELEENITALNKRVDATMTSEAVKIEIKKELDNGVNKVETNTGFTFNEDGLTVAKANSEMTTQITEDGMTVSKNNEVMLTANNEGVKATNLHAVTYLIVGNNSRFENYKTNRTGCFWIGG